jgi:hypothetical protein
METAGILLKQDNLTLTDKQIDQNYMNTQNIPGNIHEKDHSKLNENIEDCQLIKLNSN